MTSGNSSCGFFVKMNFISFFVVRSVPSFRVYPLNPFAEQKCVYIEANTLFGKHLHFKYSFSFLYNYIIAYERLRDKRMRKIII